MVYYDLFCTLVCVCFCVGHFIVSLVNAKRMNKKITSICEKCGVCLTDGEEHDCELSSSQLKALTSFVLSLKNKE